MTSLTLDEFQQLVPPLEAAFQAHLAAWRLDGKPRTARQFRVYKNCPLPTPEDRLLEGVSHVLIVCEIAMSIGNSSHPASTPVKHPPPVKHLRIFFLTVGAAPRTALALPGPVLLQP